MIVLYHCISARSFRPLWLMEEIGLRYELHMLPFPPRVLQKSFLDINPTGTVPLLIDGATRMTESAAICEYLAARYSPNELHVAPDDTAFGDYLNFLHFGEATLTFPQTLLLRYGRFEATDRRQPQVVEDYAKWFHARLRTLEPRLSAQDYLCSRGFTAADVSVGYALLLASHLGLDTRFTPAVAAYWQRMQNREAYQRALSVQQSAALTQGVPQSPASEATPSS